MMRKITSVIGLCFLISTLSTGAGTGTRNAHHSVWDPNTVRVVDSGAFPWIAASQSSDQRCENCKNNCVTARDSCRKNVCSIIGADPDTQQACRNAKKDTPENRKKMEEAERACFDQDRRCQAACC